MPSSHPVGIPPSRPLDRLSSPGWRLAASTTETTAVAEAATAAVESSSAKSTTATEASTAPIEPAAAEAALLREAMLSKVAAAEAPVVETAGAGEAIATKVALLGKVAIATEVVSESVVAEAALLGEAMLREVAAADATVVEAALAKALWHTIGGHHGLSATASKTRVAQAVVGRNQRASRAVHSTLEAAAAEAALLRCPQSVDRAVILH